MLNCTDEIYKNLRILQFRSYCSLIQPLPKYTQLPSSLPQAGSSRPSSACGIWGGGVAGTATLLECWQGGLLSPRPNLSPAGAVTSPKADVGASQFVVSLKGANAREMEEETCCLRLEKEPRTSDRHLLLPLLAYPGRACDSHPASVPFISPLLSVFSNLLSASSRPASFHLLFRLLWLSFLARFNLSCPLYLHVGCLSLWAGFVDMCGFQNEWTGLN